MHPSSREVLGAATARLAHEIKNSLAGIIGGLEVLRDRLSPTVEVDEVLDRVDAEVKRIEGSVKELTTYATPTAAVLTRTRLRDVIERSLENAPLSAR